MMVWIKAVLIALSIVAAAIGIIFLAATFPLYFGRVLMSISGLCFFLVLVIVCRSVFDA